MKEGASVLGAELTESVAVSSLESDVYVSLGKNMTYPFHIDLLCKGVSCTLAEEGDLLADQVLHPGVPVPAQVPQGVAQELPLLLP